MIGTYVLLYKCLMIRLNGPFNPNHTFRPEMSINDIRKGLEAQERDSNTSVTFLGGKTPQGAADIRVCGLNVQLKEVLRFRGRLAKIVTLPPVTYMDGESLLTSSAPAFPPRKTNSGDTNKATLVTKGDK